MLFEIDDIGNINIARGYGVTFPVGIRNADTSDYDMLPTDVLTFTVRNSINSQTNIFQVTSNEKNITLPSSATANVNYGVYKYDITLTRAEEVNFHETETEQGTFYNAPVITPSSGILRDASIEQIGGRTLAWNQLVQNGNFASASGWNGVHGTISASDNVLTYTVSTPNQSALVSGNVIGTVTTHKYFIVCDVKYNNTLPSLQVAIGSGGYDNVYGTVTALNTWTNVAGIFTRTSGGDDKVKLYLRTTNCTIGDTINIRNVWCVDLTLMYGSGNEPTLAEFTAQFPAQYYPYNAGTLLSAGVTSVVSKKADTTTIATYPIPASIQAIEGYGWSAGSVYNYVDFERKVFVQNVGKVVLDGTQTFALTNWRAQTNSVGFAYTSATPLDAKHPATLNIKANILSAEFPTITYGNAYNLDTTGIALGDNPSYGLFVRVADTSLTTASAINTYLSAHPITVYYELATPIETDISQYLTDDNLISVEAGGTLTFENQHGDDYRIPVPATLVFNAYWGRTDTWIETIVTPKNFTIGGDDNALIDSYRKLLTSEYRHSPNLTNWLLWLLNAGTTYTTFIQMFIKAFDLDVAEGQQLDTIGRLVGVKRLLEFIPSGGESPVLDDETYRFLIKATIIKNTWKGKLEDLYSAWSVLYPETKLFQIQDLQDMTFNVIIAGDFSSLQKELISKGYIIPKPEGVRINLMTITDTSGYPLFSYDMDTLYYSGYTSHWAQPTP